jgi:hypothetical protein
MGVEQVRLSPSGVRNSPEPAGFAKTEKPTGDSHMPLLPRLLVAASLLLPSLARAADAPEMTLELNKLEPVPATAAGGTAGCRAYLVASNPEGGPKLDALRLDLVLFGADGVIARRIALDVGPVMPGRIQVRPFELHNLPCDSIGQILVNDALICKVDGADQTNCLDRVKMSSRVPTKLVK